MQIEVNHVANWGKGPQWNDTQPKCQSAGPENEHPGLGEVFLQGGDTFRKRICTQRGGRPVVVPAVLGIGLESSSRSANSRSRAFET